MSVVCWSRPRGDEAEARVLGLFTPILARRPISHSPWSEPHRLSRPWTAAQGLRPRIRDPRCGTQDVEFPHRSCRNGHNTLCPTRQGWSLQHCNYPRVNVSAEETSNPSRTMTEWSSSDGSPETLAGMRSRPTGPEPLSPTPLRVDRTGPLVRVPTPHPDERRTLGRPPCGTEVDNLGNAVDDAGTSGDDMGTSPRRPESGPLGDAPGVDDMLSGCNASTW